jgi:predicted XRE-type DNA-binding protein
MTPRKNEANQTISIDPRQFNAIMKAINNLTKVYAAGQIRRDAPTVNNARFLRIFDFSQQEIADLLGISQQAVDQALSKTKKDKTKVSPKGSDDPLQET